MTLGDLLCSARPFCCLHSHYHSDTLSLRSVSQDSEVVIENVAAMYGAGFHVKENVYISVGHSVHSLPYIGEV